MERQNVTTDYRWETECGLLRLDLRTSWVRSVRFHFPPTDLAAFDADLPTPNLGMFKAAGLHDQIPCHE
jgi:hypothetical protein